MAFDVEREEQEGLIVRLTAKLNSRNLLQRGLR